MKRILFLFGLLLVSMLGMAQAPSNYTNINGRYRWIAGMFDSTFHIPKGTTPSLRTGGSTNPGALFYKTGDSSLQVYTGSQWLRMLKVGDTTGMLTPYFNSVGVGLKSTGQQVYADTLLLSTRLWRNKGIDSIQANLTSGLATKVNISDTASMLSPYARTVNVRAIIADSLGGLQRLKALNSAGAVFYSNSNTKVAEWGLGGGANFDFHGFAGYNINRAGSYTVRSFTDKNYVDSAISASPSGTVTSVATNNGTGITGGTFTTSGTIAADTLLLSTRAWRQKGIDSVAALLPAAISGTTNYIPKFTSSSAIGNSNIYEASGSIGIGTISPVAGLDVRAVNNTNLSAYFFANSSDFKIVNATGYTAIGTSVANPLVFLTSDAEGMRLTSTGLGIGTAAPSYKLDVAGVGRFSATEDQVDITGGSGNSKRANTIYRGTNASGTSKVGYIGVNVFSSDGTFDIAASDNIKLLTGGVQRMLLDASGNLGLGVTPSAWYNTGGYVALQVANSSLFGRNSSSELYLSANTYYDLSGNATYIASNYATQYRQNNGVHSWQIAASGTAGNAISFTQAMTLNASGNLSLGNTDNTYLFDMQKNGGNASVVQRIKNIGTSTNDDALIYFNTQGSRDFSIGLDRSTGTFNFTGAAADVSSTVHMAIDAISGNVGIGTTTINGTGTVLALYHSADAQMRLQSANTGQTASDGALISLASDNSMYIYNYENTPLIFGTNNAERMRITSGGNVGIGTTSPSNLLSLVQSNSASSTTLDITNSSNASTTTKTAQLLFRISDTENGLKPAASIIAYPDGVNNISSGMYFSTRSGDGGPFERMRITSSGNVGIGTTSPNDKLEVNGAIFTTSNTVLSTTKGAIFDFNDGQDAGRILTYKSTGSNLLFYTNPNAGGLSERMRITSGGEVLINTTSDAGDYKLQVNGNVYAAGNIVLRAASGTTLIDLLSSGAGSKNYRITSQITGVSNTGFAIYNATDTRNEFQIDGSGNAELSGSIKTAAPTGGTAKPWKLGERVATGVTFDSGQYIRVEIDGVTYYLATVSID